MRLPCENSQEVPRELQLEKYLHMDRVYKGMNKVIICKTQYKRPLIKRTNEECLQLS